MSAKTRPKILWSKAICKEPGDYIEWPTIARKADGELMGDFAGARDAHVCPYGRPEVVGGREGGTGGRAPGPKGPARVAERSG